MSWASLATEFLWPNALVVVPLAAAVAAICRWIPCRPTTRHSLWVVVLLWFVVPPLLPELHASATGERETSVAEGAHRETVPVRQFYGGPERGAESLKTWPRYAWTMPPDPDGGLSTVTSVPKPSEVLPRVRRVTEVAESAVPVPTSVGWQVFPSLLAVRDAVGRLPSIPSSVWLLGMAVVVLIRLVQVATFRRMMRDTRPASGDVIDAVAAASRQIGLRRAPETLMMGDGEDGAGGLSPFVWCGLRTQLILPAGLWSRLDEPGQRSVILHELAHIARRDPWVCRLTWAVCCVYWWHPVAWWVRSRLREEADYCCDGWVTWLMPRGRRAYAEALLTTKQYISLPRIPIPELAIGALSGGAKGFADRIRFIMTQSVGPRSSAWGVSVVVLMSLAGWAATPVRPSASEAKPTSASRTNVVTPVVYVPSSSSVVLASKFTLESKLLLLERRMENLSAEFARLSAPRAVRGMASSGPVVCPICAVGEESIARASASLRSQIIAIEVVAREISTKAEASRNQSHELRMMAAKMTRRPKASGERIDRALDALLIAAKVHSLSLRSDAADSHARALASQVRVLERCSVQLQKEAETLDREQARLGVRVAPLRDWAAADEPGPVRRRM